MRIKQALLTFTILFPIIFSGGATEMTQKSYPWAGVAPANGADAGPYTAEEWWGAWAAIARSGGIIVPDAGSPLRTRTEFANNGVFASVDLQLQVGTSGGLIMSVSPGAALIDGQFYYNDTLCSLTLPPNTTDGYIVIRKNYTGVDYTPGVGTGTVPAYTTRPTWVAALTQSTDRSSYWDLPLWKFTTDATSVTDSEWVAEYVDAEVKTLFVPSYSGYNQTTGAMVGPADLSVGLGANDFGLPMIDANRIYGYGRFIVPEDYINFIVSEDFISVKSVISSGAGDVYYSTILSAGACGENKTTHSASTSIAAVTVAGGSNVYNCIQETEDTSSNFAPGDIVLIKGLRDSTNVLDTIGGTVVLHGFIVTYLGWR